MERRVKWYLIFRGYRILQTNFYAPHGEIDIIAQHGKELIFVEVRSKTEKSSLIYGSPAESVDYRKQNSIIKSARHYIKTYHCNYQSYRFDVAEVIKLQNGKIKINHIKNAFIIDSKNSR